MEAPKASNGYTSDSDNQGDDQLITSFFPQEEQLTYLWYDICIQFLHWMATTGKTLPSQWSLPEFSRAVIGEEAVQNLPYLSDVFSDLSLHGSQSWYWEEASQLLTLITSSVIC